MTIATPVPITKVALYYTRDIMQKSFNGAIAVFGQLTNNGSPVEDGQFVLGHGFNLLSDNTELQTIGKRVQLDNK